jgi:KDO2-lipid IV(A) lauroyltransferase
LTAPASAPAADAPIRCGIDSVEIVRIERLLQETPALELSKLYSAQELADSGGGPGRAASLAARYAAKEACVKLFPRELAAGRLEPADFSVVRDGYGAPQIACSANARAVLDRARVAGIAVSLTHDRTSASAVTLALPMATSVPLAGKLFFHVLPFRRSVIVDNLRGVFGAAVPASEIERLAQAHYAHLWQLVVEFFRFRWLSPAAKRAQVRVDNLDVFADAFRRGHGVLVLTGHFGNWEVATVAGIQNHPEVRGRFHFVRRPIKPRWLDALVTRRFARAGFGVIAKRGSLERIVSLLEGGDIIVFPFDQYAGGADGIDVEFFGRPAGTFKSLAVIALATGAPVLPAASWREPDGRHVLKFEAAVPAVDVANVSESIARTTRAYNAAIERLVLRHPEQWWWVHRRWKSARRGRRRSGRAAARAGAEHGAGGTARVTAADPGRPDPGSPLDR